jgi:outer membrane protein OmpA-like peptidoglycan-associated protein
MNRKRLFVCAVVAAIAVAASSTASALTKGFEASSFHPAVDGGPYFTLYGSEALAQWQWVLGTQANYAYRPFQLVDANGNRVRGIIDHAIIQDVYASVGLVGQWLQLGLDVPVAWWLNYQDPNVATAPSQQKIAMGDVIVNLKSEFLKVRDHRVGIALLPFVTLPTGKGAYFNGAGGVTGGGKLIFEFLPVDRWHIALNAGALFRQKFTLNNVEQYHQLLYGLGTAVDLTKRLSIAAEATGRAKLTGLFDNKQESPAEVDGGLKYAFDNGVMLDAGGGAGIVRGSGAPTYRAFLGVAYKKPIKEEAPAPAAAVVSPLEDLKGAVVHFVFDDTEFASMADAETMTKVTSILKEVPNAKIRIVGYTDKVGTEKYNQKLSLRRANKVKTYLVKHGIDASRLSVEGMGTKEPVGDNKTKSGRAANRRAVFLVVDDATTPAAAKPATAEPKAKAHKVKKHKAAQPAAEKPKSAK